MVGWNKRSALKPFSQDVGCKSRCFLWAGELWVGSKSGLINVWLCEATFSGLVHGQENEMIAALFFVRLCVLLRGLIIGNNPSQTECCFLVAEHSTSRMWAGWILYITLWYVPFGCMLSYKDHLRSTNIKSTFRKFIKYLRREQFR